MQHRRSILVRGAILAALLVTTAGPGVAQAAGRTNPRAAAGTGSVVGLRTNYGVIHIELFRSKAPKTTENFLLYAKRGLYTGTVFHRVIDNFMIQGGGLDKSLNRRTTLAAIQNEADNGLKNRRGTVAMARTGDPHSATSQFFINLKHNTFLDHTSKTQRGWGYCVFGRVIKGMDVVDRIRKVRTTSQPPHQNVPVNPVVIEAAWIVK